MLVSASVAKWKCFPRKWFVQNVFFCGLDLASIQQIEQCIQLLQVVNVQSTQAILYMLVVPHALQIHAEISK